MSLENWKIHTKEGINYIRLGDQESLYWKDDTGGGYRILPEFKKIKKGQTLF